MMLGQMQLKPAPTHSHVKGQIGFEAVFKLNGEAEEVAVELASLSLVEYAQDRNRAPEAYVLGRVILQLCSRGIPIVVT